MHLLSLFKKYEDVRPISSGDALFLEGEVGDMMYVVLEGEVEILLRGRVVDSVGPGDIVGEMALIDSSARSASAVAKTDCRVAAVNERRFLLMVDQTPSFAIHVMRVLANRLRRMDASV